MGAESLAGLLYSRWRFFDRPRAVGEKYPLSINALNRADADRSANCPAWLSTLFTGGPPTSSKTLQLRGSIRY
jgi:hypothetical protein